MKEIKVLKATVTVPAEYEVYHSTLLKQKGKLYSKYPLVMEEIEGVAVEFFLATEEDDTFLSHNPDVIAWMCSKDFTVNATYKSFKRIK